MTLYPADFSTPGDTVKITVKMDRGDFVFKKPGINFKAGKKYTVDLGRLENPSVNVGSREEWIEVMTKLSNTEYYRTLVINLPQPLSVTAGTFPSGEDQDFIVRGAPLTIAERSWEINRLQYVTFENDVTIAEGVKLGGYGKFIFGGKTVNNGSITLPPSISKFIFNVMGDFTNNGSITYTDPTSELGDIIGNPAVNPNE